MKQTNIELLAEKIKSDPISVIEDLVAYHVCPYDMNLSEQVDMCENTAWCTSAECRDCWNK